MRKRNRACEECHRLKIKCDVNALTGEGCERCTRNKLECVLAAPRLQRDRISELEAQVQELQLALSTQSRSLTPRGPPSHPHDSPRDAVLSFLDSRISLDKQEELLHVFAHQAGAAWPVVRISLNLDQLRAKCPTLLFCVLAYTTPQETQGIDMEVHDELLRESMLVLGQEVIGKGDRSLELVQALLIATFWSKVARKGQQGSCYQILQLAADMAIDIGIAGSSLQATPPAYFCQHENSASAEARRTWLACFVAHETSAISTRRPSPVPWNSYHRECLTDLEQGGEPSDILLCQIVRVAHLRQEITDNLHLCQLDTFLDGNDYSTHATIEMLRNKVDVWAAQIPLTLAWSQMLKVWQHVAIIHIYEVILHTRTNRASFSAPYIPGRIAVEDFPRPINIIPPLQLALVAIVKNCHAAIDTATEMDPALVLALPAFSFAPALIYSLYVLVNVMVAATSPSANTYGQFLPKDCFRIELCSAKLRNLVAGLRALDPTLSCYSTRIIDATSWLEGWYNDYTALLRRYEKNLAK
ncbi:hypothetical protein NX059_009377 [Plenodomus lindquistii]|nr:hypothetical protein NX059_009377 [Plenodomus lindquistii]